MNNFVYRVWRLWSNVERCCHRRFAAICVRHPQEWSFRHASTTVGERSQTPTPSTVSSFFYLLAAGLSLFLLLGLSACDDNFWVAEGGGSRTPNPPMSSSKSFFFQAAGPPLLKSPVLLELSSLNSGERSPDQTLEDRWVRSLYGPHSVIHSCSRKTSLKCKTVPLYHVSCVFS